MALRVISSQSLFDTDSSKDDGGELGRLMHDFRVKEAKEMQAGALKDRVHELKETEKGVEHMCKEMEALRLEGVEEGRLEEKRENAKSMAEDGMTVDRIAKEAFILRHLGHFVDIALTAFEKPIELGFFQPLGMVGKPCEEVVVRRVHI